MVTGTEKSALRYTFAIWLAKTGVPSEVVGELGGWAQDSSRMVFLSTHAEGVFVYCLTQEGSTRFKGGMSNLAHDSWPNLAQMNLID